MNASRTWAIADAPNACTRSSTNCVVSRFFSDRLMKRYSDLSNSSPIASSSARSIFSLKMMRPTVVRMWPVPWPYGRYSATSWSFACPCSTDSSASCAVRYTCGWIDARSIASSASSSGP